MAQQHPTMQETNVQADEIQDRGISNFTKNKEEENKPREEPSPPEFAKVHMDKSEEKKEGEHHPTLGEILHIPTSNTSSPNGEEESVEGNNKALKETIKEKVTGGRTEDHEVVDTEEKKNLMEKMKDKLPGAHKNNTLEESNPVDYPATTTNNQDDETEKKGFMEKIKEKLPGHHKDAEKVE